MHERIARDEMIYRGKIANVHRVGLRTRDGDVVDRDFFDYPGAVAVLAIRPDNKVVLIRNYRFAVNEQLWELCAGTLEEDEDPAACARRELIEETGYRAGRIEKLGEFYTAPGTTNEKMHAYLATDLVEGEQALEKHEEIEVLLRTEQEVREMIAGGEIHDGKTIAALALYWMKDRVS